MAMQWLQGCRSTTACPRTGLLFGCQKRISGGSCFEGLKIVRPWRRVGVPLEYSTYSTYSKDPGESGGSAAWRVRYSTYSTYSKDSGESGRQLGLAAIGKKKRAAVLPTGGLEFFPGKNPDLGAGSAGL